MVLYGSLPLVQYGMVWYGMVWYGMVGYGTVWYGTVWYGIDYELCMMRGLSRLSSYLANDHLTTPQILSRDHAITRGLLMVLSLQTIVEVLSLEAF